MPAGTMEPGSGGGGDGGASGGKVFDRENKRGVREDKRRPQVGSIKLYDGRPTLREAFYQRALMYIREQSSVGTPGYEIADAALNSAGLVVIDPDEANDAMTAGIAEGIDFADGV